VKLLPQQKVLGRLSAGYLIDLIRSFEPTFKDLKPNITAYPAEVADQGPIPLEAIYRHQMPASATVGALRADHLNHPQFS
jgi:hypothetical protein